jgi:hypothetical protein
MKNIERIKKLSNDDLKDFLCNLLGTCFSCPFCTAKGDNDYDCIFDEWLELDEFDDSLYEKFQNKVISLTKYISMFEVAEDAGSPITPHEKPDNL